MAVIAELFGQPDRELYLREIVRSVGVGQGAVQRELSSLVSAGLVTRRRRGHQVFYEANKQSPVYEELRSLVVKTVGMVDVLRAALAGLSDRIKLAFVYGSVAKGADKANSDLDVMIVGDISLKDAVIALQDAQSSLRREVNPSVFSADEFSARLCAGDHFISTVAREPKVFLVGEERELAELAD